MQNDDVTAGSGRRAVRTLIIAIGVAVLLGAALFTWFSADSANSSTAVNNAIPETADAAAPNPAAPAVDPPGTMEIAPGIQAPDGAQPVELSDGTSVIDLGLPDWTDPAARFVLTYELNPDGTPRDVEPQVWSATGEDLARLYSTGRLDTSSTMTPIAFLNTWIRDDRVIVESEAGDHGIAVVLAEDNGHADRASSATISTWNLLPLEDEPASHLEVPAVAFDRDHALHPGNAGAPQVFAFSWDDSGVIPDVRGLAGELGQGTILGGMSCEGPRCRTVWDGTTTDVVAAPLPDDVGQVLNKLTTIGDDSWSNPTGGAAACAQTRRALDTAQGTSRPEGDLAEVCEWDLSLASLYDNDADRDVVHPDIASAVLTDEAGLVTHRSPAPAVNGASYALEGWCRSSDVVGATLDVALLVNGEGSGTFAVPCRGQHQSVVPSEAVEAMAASGADDHALTAAENGTWSVCYPLPESLAGDVELDVSVPESGLVFDIRAGSIPGDC